MRPLSHPCTGPGIAGEEKKPLADDWPRYTPGLLLYLRPAIGGPLIRYLSGINHLPDVLPNPLLDALARSS